jgi:hypothetical protein
MNVLERIHLDAIDALEIGIAGDGGRLDFVFRPRAAHANAGVEVE